MKPIRDVLSYIRFLTGLPGYVRRRITFEDGRERLLQRLLRREENFLEVARRAIYGTRETPYRALLELAGCEFGDLERLVRDVGLETALGRLRDEGVFVTFEEFKGRAPLVRHGREIPTDRAAFDNPLVHRYYRTTTGGSTGVARHAAMDIDHLVDRALMQAVFARVQGFEGLPTAMWFDGLPGNGPGSVLSRVPSGEVPERWYSPTSRRAARPARRFRWAERGILWTARLSGARIPFPEPVPLDRSDVIARWMGETLEREGACALRTMVSRALRVALTAEEMGIDLTGAVIAAGGEPPTDAKVAAITRAGARFVANYHFTEAGAIAVGCPDPETYDELHFLADHLELVQRPRALGNGAEVGSFHFTTLLDTAPKLLLNVEIDDYGEVFARDCGCPFESFGLVRHIRRVRSFGKLTGEGVTLVGNDMVRILEDVLPGRFGGSPLDYQLLEEEDERGFTRLSLIVDPSIEVADESEIIATVLAALRDGEADAELSGSMWAQGGTLRVRRMAPIWTARGKLSPLHIASARQSGGGAERPLRRTVG